MKHIVIDLEMNKIARSSEARKICKSEIIEIGAVMLDEFRPRPGQKYALVFGNEVDGVAQEVVDAADGAIEIPQAGTKHSVNVSVAGGVVLWNFFWQIRPKR